MALKTSIFLALLLSYVSAHSMMQCANYDTASGRCLVPIRNAGESKLSQSYRFNNNPSQTCQSAYKSPITSYYSSGSSCASYATCPDPMGSIAAGSTFNVMWFARNHAVANQAPGNVQMFLSPKMTASTTADPNAETFKQNKICEGSYAACPAGNGDANQCFLSCTLPATTEAGTYTLWWYWNWSVNDGNIYATCADFVVTGSSGGSTSTTGRPANTTTSTSTSTSGRASTSTSTSGSTSTSTSGRGSTSTSGRASTSTSTSGSTSTSTSGGTSGGSSSDILIVARSPTTIPTTGSFNVTVAYSSSGPRDIVIDILDAFNYNWYGKGLATVPQGKAGSIVTVRVANNPPQGTNYVLKAWTVDAGKGNGADAWNSAYDTQMVPVTVGSALSYSQPCL